MKRMIDIVPLKGFENIYFGMRREEVSNILGQPSESRKEEYPDGSEQIILDYEDLGIDLSFSEDDDFLLGTITFYTDNFLLEKEALIGLSEMKFKEKIQVLDINDLVLEDSFEDIESKDFYSANKAISFFFFYGIVDSITIFTEDD